MSGINSSATSRQGRSPARSNIRSSSARSTTSRSPVSRSVPRNQKNLQSIRKRKDDSFLIEHDKSFPDRKIQEIQMKDTPRNLYGLDDSGDISCNELQFDGNKHNTTNTVPESSGVNGKSNISWCSSSWIKLMLMIIILCTAMQVFLWLKMKPDKFQDGNTNADLSICLRSHDELRKKMAMAFELITESGKLFKQLERQSKYQFEQLDKKHDSMNAKASHNIQLIKGQLESLMETQNQKGHTDFSRFSDKEFPVDLSEMHSLIEIALERYDADKIGIPDYALESAGASIHVPYHSATHSSGWPVMKIFGIVVWQDSRTPREIIKPDNLPGNCWPLSGQTGHVVIKLAACIIPSMVTMEHLHHSLARFNDKTLQSMPRNFSVFSWSDEYGKEKTLLGSYTYRQQGKARQTFPIQTTLKTAVEYVELQIESNYGNKDFTCIYRFRVHGEPETIPPSNVEIS